MAPRLRDPDLRPSADARRRFPAWAGRRSQLPPLAFPVGAVRRHHVPAATDVARARREVAELLTRWDVAATDLAAIRLVVSELVSHALRHDHADRVDVEVVDQGEHVTVVVEFDRGAGHCPCTAPSPVAPATLGLTVVSRLTEQWGHAEVERGGRFWAVVSTPRAVATSRLR